MFEFLSTSCAVAYLLGVITGPLFLKLWKKGYGFLSTRITGLGTDTNEDSES